MTHRISITIRNYASFLFDYGRAVSHISVMGRKRKDRGTNAPPTESTNEASQTSSSSIQSPCLTSPEVVASASHESLDGAVRAFEDTRPVVVVSGGTYEPTCGHSRHVWTRLTPQLKETVYDMYRAGFSMAAIAREAGLPSASNLYRHMEEDEEFRRKILAIREVRAEIFEEAAQEAADSADPENVAAQRLKFDNAKWRASVNDPNRYGNKTQISGNANQPIAFTIVTGVPVKEDEKEIMLNADGTVRRD